MDLSITPGAEKFIRRMIRFNGPSEGSGFRLVVSPGGCSGLSSEFTVEAEPKTDDAVVVVNGVRLFLPAESRMLLQGATIDFADSAMSTGLTFVTPNAASCGCSSSSAPPGVASVAIGSIGRKR